MLYAFVLNCYHFKDWLKVKENNDVARKAKATQKCECCGKAQEDVERYISESDVLSLCADVANASKHRNLTSRRTSIEGGDALASMDVAIDVQDATEWSSTFSKPELGEVNSFADQCLSAWDTYLTSRGISARRPQ